MHFLKKLKIVNDIIVVAPILFLTLITDTFSSLSSRGAAETFQTITEIQMFRLQICWIRINPETDLNLTNTHLSNIPNKNRNIF